MASIARARVVSGKALSTSVAEHCHAINALVTKLEHAERKVDEYQRTIGQHIAAIKKARPDDWQQVIEAECKIKKSRAYELLRIGDGHKTVEETRPKRLSAADDIARFRCATEKGPAPRLSRSSRPPQIPRSMIRSGILVRPVPRMNTPPTRAAVDLCGALVRRSALRAST